jgi:hypothetical protein
MVFYPAFDEEADDTGKELVEEAPRALLRGDAAAYSRGVTRKYQPVVSARVQQAERAGLRELIVLDLAAGSVACWRASRRDMPGPGADAWCWSLAQPAVIPGTVDTGREE